MKPSPNPTAETLSQHKVYIMDMGSKLLALRDSQKNNGDWMFFCEHQLFTDHVIADHMILAAELLRRS